MLDQRRRRWANIESTLGELNLGHNKPNIALFGITHFKTEHIFSD